MESLRTLDRLRLRAPLTDAQVATRRFSILRLLESVELVELDPAILDRASQPMPTELGNLDAIHLASCLLIICLLQQSAMRSAVCCGQPQAIVTC